MKISFPAAYPTTRGFTLIEILVVMGMLAILTAVVLVAVNPLRQFAQARNSQRQSNVAAILNAVTERIADNGGTFISSTTVLSDSCRLFLPSSAQMMNKNHLDIRPCIVPNYLPEIPFDPSQGTNTCSSVGCNGPGESYDTEYSIVQDPVTQRVTVCAPFAQESVLASSTSYCLSR
jgi:prepilin-type N-terminal cleavage/methylation domain-containing protein